MGEEKHHADYSNFVSNLRRETLEAVKDSFEALATDSRYWVLNLSNAASLLWHAYHSLGIPVNWAGFYVVDKRVSEDLVLGPFQGKVACQSIQVGRGVCGVAAKEKSTQCVPDVEEFPGHIACDGETRSEIVVPILKNREVVGVLDIDCLIKDGFGMDDIDILESLAQSLSELLDWP